MSTSYLGLVGELALEGIKVRELTLLPNQLWESRLSVLQVLKVNHPQDTSMGELPYHSPMWWHGQGRDALFPLVPHCLYLVGELAPVVIRVGELAMFLTSKPRVLLAEQCRTGPGFRGCW